MGGQTALPMAGSGQQAGGTALGGTPIGGTPGISPMGQPPTQTQAMLAQPGYSAPTGMGSAASALSQLEAARNMMQGMPGQMGMGGQDPRLIGGGPAPDYGAMIQRQSGNPGMGQPGMGQPTPLAGMTQQQLQQHYGLFPAAQPAGQPGMGQPFPGMGQPGMGRSPGMPAAPPGSHERFLQGLTGGQLQEALQGQLAKTAEINARANSGQPGMGSAASAMSQPQKQIGATYTMGQPGTPPGLGVTQQQLQQLQRAQAAPMAPPSGPRGVSSRQLGPDFSPPTARQDQMRQFNPSQMPQASPMQRPEMAGGMPQQRPGFNMPQSFQDRLPPQFSQGLGALAQNMRNRVR